jgi:hypothetical protein
LDAEFFEAEEFFSTPPSSGDESLVGLAVWKNYVVLVLFFLCYSYA